MEGRLLEARPLLPGDSEIENGQVETTPSARSAMEIEDIEAVLREKLPRYSVLCNGQSVDVFANVRMSQVYGIAQDYFQRNHDNPSTSNREESTVIAIESMEVFPLSDPRTNCRPRQRPKSMYYSSSKEVVYPKIAERTGQIFPGMYMSKTIGPDGGSVSIQGAKLTIPVNALTVSTEIRLGVVWNGGPQLEPQQALLSSVVACEPHGLVFEVPVNLEIQHSAQITTEWELCIMRSNTSVFQGKRK